MGAAVSAPGSVGCGGRVRVGVGGGAPRRPLKGTDSVGAQGAGKRALATSSQGHTRSLSSWRQKPVIFRGEIEPRKGMWCGLCRWASAQAIGASRALRHGALVHRHSEIFYRMASSQVVPSTVGTERLQREADTARGRLPASAPAWRGCRGRRDRGPDRTTTIPEDLAGRWAPLRWKLPDSHLREPCTPPLKTTESPRNHVTLAPFPSPPLSPFPSGFTPTLPHSVASCSRSHAAAQPSARPGAELQGGASGGVGSRPAARARCTAMLDVCPQHGRSQTACAPAPGDLCPLHVWPVRAGPRGPGR